MPNQIRKQTPYIHYRIARLCHTWGKTVVSHEIMRILAIDTYFMMNDRIDAYNDAVYILPSSVLSVK